MAFYIITDSASDLPQDIKKMYNVHVIPTPVMVDEVDYFDGETIFPDEFYKLQAEGHDIKTYHVSQLMFEEHFLPFAKSGDELLYICFSTGIAGTFNAARLAVDEVREAYPDFKITIIDSHCASLGYGMVVTKLVMMQKNGAPKEMLIEAAQYFCSHMRHVFTVDSLEYLYKGGRISKTSATVGTALSIKPIIIVDENGSLKSIEKIRGWKNARKRMIEKMGEESTCLKKQMIGIAYGRFDTDLDALKLAIQEKYGATVFLKGQVGCAIGAHTGPTIMAVLYLGVINETYEKYIY